MTSKLLALIALLCSSAAAIVYAAGWGAKPGPENFSQTRIQFPNTTMLDASEQKIMLGDMLEANELVVINFSYTTCESICPLGNQILQFVDQRRAEVNRSVRLLTITIDPQIDTPEKMRAAATAFGASENWHWLTSSPTVIAEILDAADASVTDIQFHDPIFLVGEWGSGRYFRSLSMPDADEIISMLRHLNT